MVIFFFSSRRRHTRCSRDWSSDVCSSDLIAALAKRFPGDAKSDLRAAAEQYRDAMREVMKRFPDDLDAATLFAEAGMNLHPWGLWRPDGTPEEGTEEIVATLESVIRREPNHMGAIHYYIHSVEASNSPERALAGANRLAELAPAGGHIVHMPAHIYIRTGDYEAALKTNQKAALADQAYIKGGAAPGIYSMMYYSHNLHFIAMAAAMNGNYAESRRGAQLLAANVGPHVKDTPGLGGFMTVPMAVEVRFHRWNEILKMPQPDPAIATVTVFWHFARGLALAGTGDVDGAAAEHKMVAEAEEKTSPEAIFQMPINNKTKDILKIAENVLGAKISLAKNDMDATVNQLPISVAVEDGLKYDEPKDWFYPVRESLGAALLKIGDYAGAEEVFRADLERNPRNPRSLFGLEEALKAQDKAYDAGFVRRQLTQAGKALRGQLSTTSSNPLKGVANPGVENPERSEEHTSELQSRLHLVCRLLLEKKKTNKTLHPHFLTTTPTANPINPSSTHNIHDTLHRSTERAHPDHTLLKLDSAAHVTSNLT